MWLTELSLRLRAYVILCAMAIVVLGAAAYQRGGVQYVFDPSPPVIALTMRYPGASADQMLALVARPFEKEIATLRGVRRTVTTVRDGVSSFSLTPDGGVEFTTVERDLKDLVGRLRLTLPREVLEPHFARRGGGIDQSAIEIDFHGTGRTRSDIYEYLLDVIKPAVASLPGVGEVRFVGQAEKELSVELRPEALNANGITADEIASMLATITREPVGGRVGTDDSDRPLRLFAQPANVEAVRNLPLRRLGGGDLRLGAIAQVELRDRRPATYSMLNGHDSVTFVVHPLDGADIVTVSRAVRQALEAIDTVSAGFEYGVVVDNSEYASHSVDGVKRAFLEGVLLSIVIVAVFLRRVSSVTVSAITLPVSVAACLALLHVLGVRFNMFTLLALTLSVGVIIDDAIVVRESIDRHRHKGYPCVEAARLGTVVVGRAVCVTSLAIVAMLLPLFLLDSPIASFLHQFAAAATAAVVASLLVSLTLDPCLSTLWDQSHRPQSAESGGKRPGRVAQAYRNSVAFCVRHGGAVLLVSVLAAAGALYMAAKAPRDFLPSVDESIVDLAVNLPPNSPQPYLLDKARQMTEALQEFPEVRLVSSGVGTSRSRSTIWFFIMLVEPERRDFSAQEMTSRLRRRLTEIGAPDVTAKSPSFDLSLTGAADDGLANLRTDVIERVSKVPGIVHVGYADRDSEEVVRMELDRRRLEDLGVDYAQLARVVGVLLGGEVVGSWTSPSGRLLDIRVGLPDAGTSPAATLGSVLLTVGSGAAGSRRMTVPLSYLVSLKTERSPRIIRRENGVRTEKIQVAFEGRALSDVTADVRRVVAQAKAPPGTRVALSADAQILAEATTSVTTAVVLGFALVASLLIAVFKNLRVVAVVLLTFPVAVLGGLLTLSTTGRTLNLFSGIGLLLLVGLAAKNGILLVDRAETLRHAGARPVRAALIAVRERTRPIWMTTLATVGGMTPLALELHRGCEQYADMARVLVGGMLLSTLTTTLMLPALYVFILSRPAKALAGFPARWRRAPSAAAGRDHHTEALHG